MPFTSPSTRLPTATWSSHLRRLGAGLTAAAIVVATAAGLTVSSAYAAHTSQTAPTAVDVQAQSTIQLRGRLWIDCLRDGRSSVQDPPVRGAIVELVTPSGQLSTTVTGSAGGFAFTVNRGLPETLTVPLIQTPLDGLAPSPPSDLAPGRSVGRRVADLDRVEVTAAGTERATLRYDFGFIAATARGRALVHAECPHASRSPSRSSRSSRS